MSQSSSSPQTPAVRTFQMDGSTQGSLASSVNLFRGDVNLTQTLLTLPGRSGDGLDVSIAIQYQSNVFREATTWNAEAPTGVLGLGWSLPLTWIEAEAGSSPVAATRQYVFHDNGSANRLFRQPLVPVLFTASATLAAGLADGAALPTAVRDQFRGLGLAVSTGAVVRGAGPWTVNDDALMQSYVLSLENGLLVARDGGETYQLQSYQFWKVLYYPSYERWVVISESGMRRTFGGRTAATPQGFATSLGNSVAWSVYWSDGAGRPVWTGPSNQTAGQVQVARAWYLHEIRDRFGSAVVHTYNGGARTASGILPVAEQQVGVGGKPHTRAVYLDTITDSFGRTLRFKYAAKLCTDRVREYVDPHRETPSDAPGPYQDRYETQYLAGVDVDSATGTRLYAFVFDYAPRPAQGGASRAVADLTGGGQRDRFKRLLTSVTQRDRDGVASPAVRFTYDLGPDTAGGQPGALIGVTQPQGGTARYTYARQDLPLCDRTLVVDRPAGVPDGATSRVFHGPDYVVVCYYNQSWGQLSLQVFTWTGRWVGWMPGASAVIDTSGLSLETLRVHAQADFLAVSFNRTNGDLPLYVFQRDAAKPGQWQPGTVDGVTAGVDRPNVVYRAQGMAVEIRGGDTFLVVGQMNPATLTGSHDVLTWRWTTQAWTRAATNLARYSWIAAGAEWFAVLGNDGRLTLSYLDGTQTWRQAAPVQLAGLALDKLTNLRIVAGAGMLVVANLTASSAQNNTYRLHTVQWSGDYAASVASHGPFTDAFGPNNAPLSWTPTVVKDTLVAVNGNLLRRVGGTWSVDTSLNLANPPGGTSQRFAYASDCAVRVCVPTNGTPTAEVAAYDPTAAVPWTRATPSVALSPQTSPRDNWPFAGDGDWLIIGPHAWFRGAATSWAQCVAQAPAVNLASAVRDGTGDTYARFYSESLVDQAPGFWAFTVEQGGSQSAHAIVLRSGAVAQYCRFAGEKLYTASSGGVGGAGVSAAGPRSFTSFPSHYPTLDGAQSIMIHRYAGHAVDGAITHYTVVAAELEDGFGQRIPIAYAPDLATAAADTSGDVVKFYETTVYPGSSGAPYAPYGSIVSRYLNGAAERTGDQFDDALDGLLIATETRAADGTLLESVRSTWGVFRQVAASATDPNAPAVQLRGAWVTQAAEERMKDGIAARKLTSYVPTGFTLPVTGQPVVEALSSVGGSGTAETFTRVVRHGVHHYSSLWVIHALADVVQVDTFVNPGGGAVLQSASATGYSNWASNAGEGVKTPAPAAGFSLQSGSAANFPFVAWSPGQRPPGWLLTTQTNRRTRHGQETACIDASGVSATTITDRKAIMPVASIANATPIECAYLGFQDYEDASGWTLTGVTYDKSDACAGTRSAVLAGDGSATIGVSARPTRPDTWFVGCRFRTLAGFVANGSGLEARVDLGNGQSTVVSLAWTATSGAWTYVTLPVPVAATSMDGVGTITVTARNTAGSSVWVDSVLVAPLVTAATMRTFDPDSQQVLASSDASGRLTRTFYDRTFQPVVSVGPTGLVREISGSFLSRAGSAADAFDPAAPNVELTLHTAAGGVLESFRDGKLWATRWRPAAMQDWSLGNGALVHTLATSSAITWATRPTGTYAIYFEPQTNDAAAAISLAAGDVTVQWSGAGWSARQAGAAWTRLGARTTAATHWLLVVGDGVVCFFADGQLLFSRRARPVGDTVTLGVAGTVRLRNLTGVQDIRLGLSYNDAGGRQRQIHQLRGDDSLVCAVVFDALDRRLATTRSAPGSFGSGADTAPLAYRPGFLDVAAFLQATASSWIMSGDVADYYRGQSEGEIARSNDQGYPYHGIRYEESPRSVQVEVGQPGRELAIDLTVPKQGRRTVQVDYGVNAEPVGAMPAGQYRETRVTSAVKTVATRLLDRLEQQVSASLADASGTLMARSVGARSYAATGAGPTSTFVQKLPNAQVPGPQGDGGPHVRTLVANALRQTTSLADVDTGQTRFLYDSAGNLRFVQPAMGAGEQWYVFYRYDALGRQVAEGIVKGAWDPAWLQQRLDDRQFPSAVDPTVTVIVSTEYDGPGDVPTLIGRRWRTTTNNPAASSVPGAGEIVVKEEFAYAVGGEVVRATQTVSGAVKASGALGYAYNALGELVRVDLPAGCPFAAVFYRYDDHGDIAAIGSTAGGSELGKFTYSADRQPQGWSVAEWTRALEYTSQGWVRSQITRSTVGGQSFAVDLDYEADGALSSRSVNYSFSGYTSGYHDSFSYDGRRRLTGAAGSSDSQYTAYDPNGNLWACKRNGRPSSFSHFAGTNRVQSASVEGAAASAFTWNARGQLTSGLGRSFEYVPATGRTRAITTGAARLALAYGAAQQRVVKQNLATGRVNVYFRGAGQVPIATLVNGAWRVTVCGPLGPVAWIVDRTPYYLLTDATGSVWGAVAGGALSFATAWAPYGSVGASHGDSTVVPYGFQGHEWDQEVGLFDFGARLYDPALCRMLAPDPQCQYPSPYVFAGGDPLTMVDPTGELSLAAKIGIGAAMVGLAAAGVALTVATAGASAPALTAAGTALASSMTAGQAASMMAVGTTAATAAGTAGAVQTAAVVAAAGAVGGAAASAGVAASSQIMAGVSTTAASATSMTVVAGGTAGSTMLSAGLGGLNYTMMHGQDFKTDDFFKAVGIGAAAGFAGGVVTSAMMPLTQGVTVGLTGMRALLGDVGIGAAIGVTSGATSGSLSSILTNVAENKPWYRNLAQNALMGAAMSASAAGPAGAVDHIPREAIAKRAAQMAKSTAQRARTLPQLAKAAAKSDAAYWTVVLGADFMMYGFLIGGVATGKI